MQVGRGHGALTWKIQVFLLLVFMFSGTCALAYQVVWTRMLALVFGSTHQAIASVLAMFMLGLALGSYGAGQVVHKIRNCGRAYGFLELVLALYVLAFPYLLKQLSVFYWSVFPHTHTGLVLDTLVRLFLAALILLPPTICMGATLPLLAQYIESRNEKLGQKIGWLYGINTLGAAGGAFVSAFFMIPYFGLHSTIYVFAAINLVIGLACLWVLQPNPAPASLVRPEPKTKDSSPIVQLKPHSTALFLFILFLAGLVGMLLENGWSHALVLVFGTSVYAFATMLTTYLLGLASGCFVASRFMHKLRSTKVLAWLLVANAAAVLVSTPIIGALPGWFVTIFGDLQARWAVVMTQEFLACAALMFVPTFLNGALFPLCLHFIAQTRKRHLRTTGSNTAYAYVWNTAGSILGALVAGFIFIPLWGTERCLLLAASLLCAAGALVFLVQASQSVKNYFWVGALGLGAVLIPFVARTWDVVTMNSGVYIYSRFFEDQGALSREMKNFKLVYYQEGSVSVAVFEDPQGDRFLRVNGKTDGSSEGDNTTQMLLGYLPYLYAQDIDQALVIGFGTGITSGCVLDLPVTSLESIEISPEVLGAAPCFAELNAQVFRDQRSIIRKLDGRTWLAAMPVAYDMIISEPSNPWQTGNANLFTTEFFELAAQKLKPGGVLCQWLPYYNMDSSHFRLILASLKSVFPHTHLWMSATDTFLISSQEPLNIDMQRVTALLEHSSSAQKLRDLGIFNAQDLLSFFYLDNQAVQQMVAGVTMQNTDSFPIVEFHSPKYLLGPNRPDIFFAILEESFHSTLPLEGKGVDNFGRILSRRGFFERWRIPQHVTDQMVQRAMAP